MATTVLIPAAGSGSRLSQSTKKQFLFLGGKPILSHTIAAFDSHPDIDHIVLILPADEINTCTDLVLTPGNFSKVRDVVIGGDSRQQSVLNGIRSLDATDDDIILVHDGARPFISTEIIGQLIDAARQTGAAIVATRVKDTIKVAKNSTISSTPDRNTLWAAQTPQAFKWSIIEPAYSTADQEGITATDDASLVESTLPVTIIEGDYRNIKITTPEDMAIAELFLNKGVD